MIVKIIFIKVLLFSINNKNKKNKIYLKDYFQKEMIFHTQIIIHLKLRYYKIKSITGYELFLFGK